MFCLLFIYITFDNFYYSKYNDHIQLGQLLSLVKLLATPCTAACQVFLSITNSWSLLRLMSIELVMPSSHLILCHTLLLLPSIFPKIRVFSNDSVLHIRLAKYWSFSFSNSFSNDIQGWFPSRWTGWISQVFLGLEKSSKGLSSLLHNHSSKTLILWHSVFIIVQLSHPYMTTGKTIALSRWSLLAK